MNFGLFYGLIGLGHCVGLGPFCLYKLGLIELFSKAAWSDTATPSDGPAKLE